MAILKLSYKFDIPVTNSNFDSNFCVIMIKLSLWDLVEHHNLPRRLLDLLRKVMLNVILYGKCYEKDFKDGFL